MEFLVVLVIGGILFMSLWVFLVIIPKKAMDIQTRSSALSQYVGRFGLMDARCLNDLALSDMLDSVNRKWGRATLTCENHFFMTLESFIAIRDRVDALEGRSSGQYNKGHIRNAVTVATLDLNKRTSYFDQQDMIGPFRFRETIPNEHLEYFCFHLGVMEHVYIAPNEDYSKAEYRKG